MSPFKIIQTGIFSIFCLLIFIISCTKDETPVSNPEPEPVVKEEQLVISNFSPKTAASGASIIIEGLAFGTDSNAIGIKFGSSATVKPRVITSTSMTVNVPADATTGKIELTVNTKKATSTDNFTLSEIPAPVLSITDFSPKKAKITELVTINGSLFGTDPEIVSISFGGAPLVKPKTISASQITVEVPAQAKTGKIELTVMGKVPAITTEDFTLEATPVSIESFAPASAAESEIVTIKGTGFGIDTNVVGISFGGTAAIKPLTISLTQLTVVVPENAKTGKLSVAVDGGTPVLSSNDFTFKVIPLTISSITDHGKVGVEILILGTGFGTDNDRVTVSFGGSVPVKPKIVNPTNLTVVVPADAKSGKVTIRINGTAVTSQNDFNLQLSVISFSPKNITEGDTVIIKGAQFGTDVNDIYVDFNNVTEANKAIKVTPTEIWAIVPFDAKPGFIRISGKHGTEFDYSKEQFTFTPRVYFNDYWNFLSARAGEIIKINVPAGLDNAGINDVTVSFGGAPSTHPLSVQKPDIFVRVPANAKTGKITIGRTGWTSFTGTYVFTVLPPMPEVQPGVWTKRPDFATASFGGRAGAIVFTINNKAYVGCGSTNAPFDGFANKDMWEYDAEYNAWTQKADFAGGTRVNAAAFSIGSKGYVGTGRSASEKFTNDFWEYDPLANSWVQKADFIGSSRSNAVGFAINTTGYIGSGGAGNVQTDDFYEYSPSANQWVKTSSIPGERTGAFAFVAAGKAYIGGGFYRNNSKNTGLSDLYMFDPAGKTWTAKAGIANYAYTAYNSSFTIGSNGYVGLGSDVSQSVAYGTTKVYEYVTASNSWRTLPAFGGKERGAAVGFTINNIGYFGLGEPSGSTGAYRDFWAYKP